MSNTYRFKTKPYKHQRKALITALRRGHYGALWEPGTGKTKFIIDWSAVLFQQGKIKRVLIVCPFSVMGVWEEEYEIHCPLPYRILFLDKKDTKAPKAVRGYINVLVINYDLAWRRKKILKDQWKPDFVIADESHRIKKPSARRSMFMRSMRFVKYRSILTGTPSPKGLRDYYAQWVFLNPRRFGTNVQRFDDKYVRYGGYMNRQIRRYRNVGELIGKIEKDADIIRSDDVLDLPPKRFQRVPVVLEPEAWDAYQKMAYELFLELKDGDTSDAKNVAVKILRLQQITGGWIKSDEGRIHQISEIKLRTAADHMEDLFNDDERVVVFARFKPEVQALYDLGTRFKVERHVLRGGMGREERDQARRTFQTRPGPSLFVAQIQAGGLGITLHSSHEVLFYSVTYALDDYIQAYKRVHRGGQTHAVLFRHLVARNTVDIDIYANLRAKQDIMDVVMNPRGRKMLMRSLARNLGIDEG